MKLEEYLKPTEFFDYNKKKVLQKAFDIIEGLTSDKQKVVALFYWVRDEIKYNPFSYYPKVKANLKASVTLRRKNGFCMSKAVLLSTFARAIGIPARIHMVDIINHKVSGKIVKILGTKAFYCHAYSEIFLNEKWIKATPVFDNETSIKGKFFPIIEFDGENNAMFSPQDPDGNKFVEYIGDHGIYSDVPIEKIDEIFTEKYHKCYGNLNTLSLDK